MKSTVRHLLFLIQIFLSIPTAASAQGSKADVEEANPVPNLKWTPTGRIAVDAATFITPDKRFEDGITLMDARIGFKVGYGMFSGKAELAFVNEKVTLKDTYIRTTFEDGLYLQVGNFYAPYGQNIQDSSNKSLMMRPRSCETFTPHRMLGVMGSMCRNQWHAAAGIAAESKASVLSPDKSKGQGWGFYTRVVYRPFISAGNILHFGLSGAVATPEYNADPELNHHSFTLRTYFPSRVSRIVSAEAVIDNARSMLSFTPEIIAARGHIAFESQFYFNHVNRKESPEYNAYGAYATISGIIIGNDYAYSSDESRLATLSPKSLELALNYSYTNLSDSNSGIRGGRTSDVSATISWHINPYIIWRLYGSYTHAFDRADVPAVDVTTLQTRFQILF